MKILNIGPSVESSRGGMAEVIANLKGSTILNCYYDIESFSSYVEGNIFKRIIHMGLSFAHFVNVYHKYDLFHIHVSTGGSVFRKILYIKFLKKKNKKVLLHFHSGTFPSFYEKQSTKKKRYIKKHLNSVDKIIVLSEKWKQIYSDLIEVRKIHILNNGIKTTEYNNSSIKNFNLVNKNFLFLGRLNSNKGIYDLIVAFTLLRNKYDDVKLIIAGDGDEELEKIDKIIKDNKLQENIKILGWINHKEKLEIFKEVGTVVLPSYFEGFPMTIVEGMAAGCAIISSNVGAIPEIISETENGFLITPGDTTNLFNNMERIYLDPKLCSAIADNNIKKANLQYDVITTHKKLYDIYDETLQH